MDQLRRGQTAELTEDHGTWKRGEAVIVTDTPTRTEAVVLHLDGTTRRVPLDKLQGRPLVW